MFVFLLSGSSQHTQLEHHRHLPFLWDRLCFHRATHFGDGGHCNKDLPEN